MGELAIFLSFGPIPCLGTYYVVTGGLLSFTPVLLSFPSGLLTTSVLLSHDKIFFDAYSQAGKRSLAVLLGRNLTNKLIFALGLVAYFIDFFFVLLGYAPVYASVFLRT